MSNTLNDVNIEELNGLSEEERKIALDILKQLSETGESTTYTELLYSEYNEIPVDIDTFIDNDYYLGRAWKDSSGNSKMYPYWRNRLRELFPTNITTSVNNTIFSGSRGIGKTEIAIAISLYLMYRLMCLKNPKEHLHLKPTERICFAYMNITKALAEDIGVSKFQETVKASPWFMARGSMTRRNNDDYWIPPDYINVIIGSQPSHVIGLPIFFAFFDEISFIKNQDIEKQKAKAIDMIDTALGGMKTRFLFEGKSEALLCLASSKRSEKSFLETHMKKKLESEKENVLIVDEPIWNVKPANTYSGVRFSVALGNKFLQSQIVPDGDDLSTWIDKGYKILSVPIEFRSNFMDDIDRALCDYAGISSSEITKYISGQAVSDIKNKNRKNPFVKDIIEVGNAPDDKVQYYDYFDLSRVPRELWEKPLFIHLDMSVSGDMTGIAGVAISGKKHSVDELSQANDLQFSLVFSVSVKAPKGRQVSFEKNKNFIYWLKEQGFRISGISSDTYQSYETGQILLAKGYNYSQISVDRVDPSSHICKPYQYFKSTIYEKRLDIYESEELTSEITDLERNINTGKVDHPDGGCFTGETKVSLVDGRKLSFLELVDEYNSGKTNYVYSVNLENGKIEPKKILKAWKTKENQPLIRITLDTGDYVDCTLNHKFMLRNGSYVEAKDLIVGESLMPLYTRVSNKGLVGYRMYYDPFRDSWHYEHRDFAVSVLDERYLVHHINLNKLDNSPDNLVWCSKKKHCEIHAITCTGANSEDARKKKSESVKRWHIENRGTDAYEERANRTREALLKFNLDRYGHNSTVDSRNRIKDIENYYNIRWEELSNSEKTSYSVRYSFVRNPHRCVELSETMSRLHRDGVFSNAEAALKEHNDRCRALKQMFPYVDDKIFMDMFGFEYSSVGKYQKGPWANRYREKLYSLKNHRVMNIEILDYTADVYDIEVEDNHNFALACGVFVHNSKDVCDAVCGAVYNASQYAEQYAYDYGESLNTFMDFNDGTFTDEKTQVIVDFEKELGKVVGSILSNDELFMPASNEKYEPYYYDNSMVIW